VIRLKPRSSTIAVPEPPKGLLKITKDNWTSYWQSALSSVADPATDMPAITRLFTLYDERERAFRCYKDARLFYGPAGQPTLNPMGGMMKTFDAEIRQMEDRLGLTPRARLQLGIVLAGAKKSMDDLNQSLRVDLMEDPR
jgi:P27 family predicted phage terminase small subunit